MRRRSRWRARTAFPILVFSIHKPGGFAEVLTGKGKFTIISD